MASDLQNFSNYKVINGGFIFGLILWILALIIIALLFSYQADCSGGQYGVYCSGTTEIIFELIAVIFIIVGSYLIFSSIQKKSDNTKFIDIIEKARIKAEEKRIKELELENIRLKNRPCQDVIIEQKRRGKEEIILNGGNNIEIIETK